MEHTFRVFMGGGRGASDTEIVYRSPEMTGNAHVGELVVALETALSQHQDLVLTGEVVGLQWQPDDDGSPDAPVVLAGLRRSTARLEVLLAELAAVVPPRQDSTTTL